MVTNLDGKRVPYVGYRDTMVGKEVVDLYSDLKRGEQRRTKKLAEASNENKYEYLEEVLIDFERAFKISTELLDAKLISGMSRLELCDLMLLFGIGVAKRRPEEIALVSGESVKDLDEFEYFIRDNYSETIDVIYDVVMQYISTPDKKKEATL